MTSLPLLGMSVLYIGMLLTPLAGFSNNWVTPFFGIHLSGISGACALIFTAVIFGYISWAAFRAKISGWWCALAMTTLRSFSTILTYLNIDRRLMYEKMNFSLEKIEKMMQSDFYWNPNFIINLSIFNWILFVAFLMLIRKQFKNTGNDRE